LKSKFLPKLSLQKKVTAVIIAVMALSFSASGAILLTGALKPAAAVSKAGDRPSEVITETEPQTVVDGTANDYIDDYTWQQTQTALKLLEKAPSVIAQV